MTTTCTWCGQSLRVGRDKVSVDHVIPRTRGGPNVAWNRELLHSRCNMEKGNTLTPRAITLAEEHGITLTEPKREFRASGTRLEPRASLQDLFRSAGHTRST